jgi:hypothetical protein
MAHALASQLDKVRTRIEQASRATVLEDETFVFRCLSDLTQSATAGVHAIEALYDMRQSCLEYFRNLERGRLDPRERTAALIYADLLEVALVNAAGVAH